MPTVRVRPHVRRGTPRRRPAWVLPHERMVHKVDADTMTPYFSEQLQWMTPEEAMRLQYDPYDRTASLRHLRDSALRVSKGDPSYEAYLRVRGRLTQGLPLDPIVLETTGGRRFTGRPDEPYVLRGNGQHRTAAAYDLGIRRVPVVVFEEQE